MPFYFLKNIPEGSEESPSALRFMGLRSIQRHGSGPLSLHSFPFRLTLSPIPQEMGRGWSGFIPALAGVHFTYLP
jgi:hypothetical protein